MTARLSTGPFPFNTAESPQQDTTRLAGVRDNGGTPVVLFQVSFHINPSSPPWLYPISVAPTLLTNSEAGSSENGETLPILVGAVKEGNSWTYPEYPATTVNGTVTVRDPAAGNSGCSFRMWSDGVTANTRTDVNVTTNLTVTAIFDVPVHAVTINIGDTGNRTGGGYLTQKMFPGSSPSVGKEMEN